MTPHPNAEYLRALADGKRVVVLFEDDDFFYPLWDCSTTVLMSLFRPENLPMPRGWSFHIEHVEPSP